MLSYILALAVGLGSFGLYMAAFFFPEVHRKNDFIWSGVGLFYALVLWVYGSRINGGLLLGQAASVALLGWSISQTLQLRRQLTPKTQQTDVPSTAAVTSTVKEQVSKSVPAVTSGVSGIFNGIKNQFQQSPNKPTPQPKVEAKPESTVAETNIAVTPVVETTPETPPLPSVEIVETTPEALTEEEAISQAVENALTPVEEETPMVAVPPHPPDPELVEAAIKDAEEKHQPVSPPDSEVPENPSPS